MKFLKAIWQFLTVKKEVTPVTDTTIVNPAPATAVTGNTATTTVTEGSVSGVSTDAVLAKLKTLLIAAGHDVENEFDDAVAYAKTLAAKL